MAQRRIDVSLRLKLRPYRCKYCRMICLDYNQLIIHTRRHDFKIRKFWYKTTPIHLRKCGYFGRRLAYRFRNCKRAKLSRITANVKHTHFAKRISRNYDTKLGRQSLHSDTGNTDVVQQEGLPEEDIKRSPPSLDHKTKHVCYAAKKTRITPVAKNRVYVCKYCDRRFSSKGTMVRHERVHTSEKPYKCSYCDKRFASSGNRLIHERSHTKQKPYICRYCDKGFSISTSRKIHERIHTNEKPYACRFCSMRFPYAGGRTVHERIHTKEKPYRCKYCDKTFARLNDTRRHERTHTNERPFPCGYCNKMFIDTCKRDGHERMIHTKEKPYHCRLCNKGFASLSDKVRHEGVHSDKRPYPCRICSVGFKNPSNRKAHERRHDKEESYPCTYRDCKRTFIRQGDRDRHERYHLEKHYQCAYCTKEFPDLEQKRRHERVHTGEKPYKCRYCARGFTNGCSRKIHERTHTSEKPYECQDCQRKFGHLTTKKKHEKIHTRALSPSGEVVKPYECQHCERKFVLLNSLRKHEMKYGGNGQNGQMSLCSWKKHEESQKRQAALSLRKEKKEQLKNKPFQCQFCETTFGYLKNKYQHERRKHATYTGEKPKEKPYQCQYCDTKFGYLRSKRQHEKRKHGNAPNRQVVSSRQENRAMPKDNRSQTRTEEQPKEKPYKCKYCDTRFGYLRGKRRHEKRKHKDSSQVSLSSQADTVPVLECTSEVSSLGQEDTDVMPVLEIEFLTNAHGEKMRSEETAPMPMLQREMFTCV